MAAERGGGCGRWAGQRRPPGLRAGGGAPVGVLSPPEPRGGSSSWVCGADFARPGSVSFWGGTPRRTAPAAGPFAPPLGFPGLPERQGRPGTFGPRGERGRANSGAPDWERLAAVGAESRLAAQSPPWVRSHRPLACEQPGGKVVGALCRTSAE